MIAYDGLTPAAFLQRITTLLDGPAERLQVPAVNLLALIDPKQIQAFLMQRIGEKPSNAKFVAGLATLPWGARAAGPAAWFAITPSPFTAAMVGAALIHGASRSNYYGRYNAVRRLLDAFSVARASVALEDKEKVLIRSYAAMFAEAAIDGRAWDRFAALMTWGDGKCTLTPSDAAAADKHVPEARVALADLLKASLDSYPAFLAASAARAADVARRDDRLGKELSRHLAKGARWLDAGDIAGGKVLSFEQKPASLIIGHDQSTGRPVYYSRNESLFTIGKPGTGKTECQVIPNLLYYPGSAFVLDVKGELWQKTAGWRAKHFGPVYRFAPTDPTGRTHRFNPFDFISTVPEKAATDCEVMSFQVVTPTANHNDPYWENRGRDFLWAMAMIVALQSKGPSRAMATLMRLLSVPLDVKANTPAFATSETARLISGLEQMAAMYKVPALAEHANAIRAGLGGQRLESVADNARRFLNIFSRSASLRAAMSASDWRPTDLREKPGMSVYLCLAGDDLDTYAPIVRLLLQQHANALLRDFVHKPGVPPITFFIDEFPQLKRMDSVLRMVDTGRGAGLRLWFFAQYLGQVRQAYGQQADGLINSCRVRSFLSPDAEGAEFVKPYLGTTTNLFSGEKAPLVETHELVGADFDDKVLVLADGPARLSKRFAWETMADRQIAPPVIPSIKRRRP